MNKKKFLLPEIEDNWWTIAGNPDLGHLNSERQQPLDFGIWQAADGTLQLWSCVRRTNCGGRNRLFFRWQADKLTKKNWKPIGVYMEPDPNFGEQIGGLQAPFVIKKDERYFILYGDWINICMATSYDGKTFARLLNADGVSGMFTEGHNSSTRDTMIMLFKKRFYNYYTGVPGGIPRAARLEMLNIADLSQF